MLYSPKKSFSQGSRPHKAKVASNIIHCFHTYALSELHRNPVVSLAIGGGLKGRAMVVCSSCGRTGMRTRTREFYENNTVGYMHIKYIRDCDKTVNFVGYMLFLSRQVTVVG